MCWQSVTAERQQHCCCSQLVFGQQRSFRSKQDRSKWHAMLQLQLLLRRLRLRQLPAVMVATWCVSSGILNEAIKIERLHSYTFRQACPLPHPSLSHSISLSLYIVVSFNSIIFLTVNAGTHMNYVNWVTWDHSPHCAKVNTHTHTHTLSERARERAVTHTPRGLP